MERFRWGTASRSLSWGLLTDVMSGYGNVLEEQHRKHFPFNCRFPFVLGTGVIEQSLESLAVNEPLTAQDS